MTNERSRSRRSKCQRWRPVVPSRDLPGKRPLKAPMLVAVISAAGRAPTEKPGRIFVPPAVRYLGAPALLYKGAGYARARSEEHTSELQSRRDIVCRLL